MFGKFPCWEDRFVARRNVQAIAIRMLSVDRRIDDDDAVGRRDVHRLFLYYLKLSV